MKYFYWIVLFLVLFLNESCKKNDLNKTIDIAANSNLVRSYNSSVVQNWQSLYLNLEKNAIGFHPCPSARMLAYVGLGVYESAVSGMPDYKSIAYLYPGLNLPAIDPAKTYHYPSVINSFYASLYNKFFAGIAPSEQIKIDSLKNQIQNIFSNTVDTEIAVNSEFYGNKIADAIWNYASSDAAGHNKQSDPRPSSFVPLIGNGLWKVTPPGNEMALFPFWGNVRTFKISGNEKLCNPPLPYSTVVSSSYYLQALDIYNQTTPQSTVNRWKAEFWSDDKPGFTFSHAARWLSISNQILEIENANLEIAVITALKVGFALNDAAVGCWNSKYYYQTERPVTYLNAVLGYSTWNVAPLTSTQFLSSTPSYPGYPSSHATLGAAVASVLTQLFGENYAFTDRSHQKRNDFNGTPRSFSSFAAMAEENANSRVFLGVNFPMDCAEGLRYGKVIGDKVNNLPIEK